MNQMVRVAHLKRGSPTFKQTHDLSSDAVSPSAMERDAHKRLQRLEVLGQETKAMLAELCKVAAPPAVLPLRAAAAPAAESLSTVEALPRGHFAAKLAAANSGSDDSSSNGGVSPEEPNLKTIVEL